MKFNKIELLKACVGVNPKYELITDDDGVYILRLSRVKYRFVPVGVEHNWDLYGDLLQTTIEAVNGQHEIIIRQDDMEIQVHTLDKSVTKAFNFHDFTTIIEVKESALAHVFKLEGLKK